MASGLMIRVEGVVSGKKISTYDGKRKCRAEVVYMGGNVSVTVPDAQYDKFPEDGQPVVVWLTGKTVTGEFGASIQRLEYVKHEGGRMPDAVDAAQGTAGMAARRPGA